MAKIALLTPTFFHYSGIDRVVEQQAGEYSKKGHEVSVFALDGDIKSKGYRLIIIGMPKNQFIQRLYRLFFFLDFIKIRKTALKLKDFDMAVSHFYPMNLIASYAKKKYGTKYLFYNHGIGYSSLFSNIFERLYMKLFGFFNSISLKNADLAVSISKFMQKELKRETGIDSAVWTTLTYDAVKIYAKIIAKVGTDKEDIMKELKKISYSEGLSSPLIEFDENGDLKDATIEVKVIRNGKSEKVK